MLIWWTALNEDGTYRESVFYNTIGEAYIPIAFAHAAKVDPNAELFYNDYNLEYNGDKTAGARRIVDLVQSYGVKIQGVGLQCHVASEETPTAGPAPGVSTLTTVLQGFTAQGVDVAYTEIEVRMNTPATPEKLAAQAQVYNNIATSCLKVKRCIGMTVWVRFLLKSSFHPADLLCRAPRIATPGSPVSLTARVPL